MVRAKKHLGQHFLRDLGIAQQIVEAITQHRHYEALLEIGAGTGVLTQFLLENPALQLSGVDVDRDSIRYLQQHFASLKGKIFEEDFLQMDLAGLFPEKMGIIGNFPYHISSQIFFKILEHRDQVMEVVCMLQKEVAQRIHIGSILNINLPDNAYDLVICREVFEHLTVLQIQKAVENLCRISSKYVYVTTRFHPEPKSLFDVTTEFNVDPTHITCMNKDMLRFWKSPIGHKLGLCYKGYLYEKERMAKRKFGLMLIILWKNK